MANTKRKSRRKAPTLKQIATKMIRSAEDEAQKLIRGARKLQRKGKRRVQKVTRKAGRARRAHAS